MGRLKKEWRKDRFYHVTTRGNNRQLLFHDAADYHAFYRILESLYARSPFTLASYCIMPNHYHLLIRSEEAPLSAAMMFINQRYSAHFRRKYGFIGQIYQKRYFSSVIDGNHGLSVVSRYIHRNPIAGTLPLTDTMEHYAHSSFKFFANTELSRPVFLDMQPVINELPPGYQKNEQGYVRYCQQARTDARLGIWIEKSEIE